MVKVGIVGASGYSGLELIKILLKHPETEISFVSGTSRVAGQNMHDIYPVLRGQINITVDLTEREELVNSDAECIFLATPNETSLDLVPEIINKTDKKVIDLSGAFRLADTNLYPQYYGFENNNQTTLKEAVYGLPELYAPKIRKTRLVANPGCYPTSIIIPIAPLLSADIVDISQPIIIDAKSGVSGAGRKPTETTHFVETNESLKAYNVHKHRHEPEIAQELSIAADKHVDVSFTPHLIPVNRGILSTIYLKIKKGITQQDILACWDNAYRTKQFVRVYPEGQLPEIKFVACTHFCDIGCSLRGDQLVIVSCIDNLLKGASSQAVQNYNLLYGYKDDLGL
jgi:N-acetyl-gamma-glutamyl-phosphate reductase